MRKYSLSQETISIIMIYLVLLLFSGCYAYKDVPGSDLTNSGKYYYEIYAGNTTYKLDNAEISDGILTGKIVGMSSRNQKIKIFLTSDSSVVINENKILTVPVDQIAKVQKPEINGFSTAMCIIIVIAALVITIGIVDFATSGVNMSI